MTDGGISVSMVQSLVAWVSANAGWVITISVAYAVISLLVIRILIVRMPADYFMPGRSDPWRNSHPAAALSLRILRNLLGAVVIVVGLVMSVPGIPGQGLLTLLIGLTLTDFPGKKRMEIWLLRRPIITKAINSVRAQSGAPPIRFPDGDGDDGPAATGREEGGKTR